MSMLTATVLLGLGATALVDAWSLLRCQILKMPLPDYALIGRWVGHWRHGQFWHQAIRGAPAIRFERAMGWIVHYLVGITFALGFLILVGSRWLQAPGLLPALAFGLATVVAPFLILQPAMGLGLAAAKAPAPNRTRLHSLITHLVFGLGLYLSAWLIQV